MTERTSAERTTVGTVEDLHASATQITGLTDFGVDDYTEALGVAARLLRPGRGPDPARQQDARGLFLRGALVARLLSEAGVEAASRARGGRDRAADLRHRPAPHRAPPRCTGCSPPTRRTRAWSCG